MAEALADIVADLTRELGPPSAEARLTSTSGLMPCWSPRRRHPASDAVDSSVAMTAREQLTPVVTSGPTILRRLDPHLALFRV